MLNGKVYPVNSARIPVQNPYILIARHVDDYPEGNGEMAPVEFPRDWQKGNDFTSGRGWNMYHGEYVPGFPAHPHRGFETITYAKNGIIDHFDSHGNYGRYGNGDIQWMISGRGLQHAEMFPLIETEKNNPFEIVQIWLNLPAHKKMVPPSYKMYWHENIPVIKLADKNPDKNFLKVLVGSYNGVQAERPVENSYGYEEENHINVWDGKLEKGERFVIPSYPNDVKVQFYVGDGKFKVDDYLVDRNSLLVYTSDSEITFTAEEDSEFMVFIGKEIKEEIYAYGPFVMNTKAEVVQAYEDFRKNQFGGWPWSSSAPTIPSDKGRFSVYDKGSKTKYPPKKTTSAQ
ncbi:pirin family protein [Vagococcus elongatus]|uniref:Pirin n=1 Tax=Vagococcus elongatus TaxID=180344 RepID=A0A430B5K3_9ENTE|nr:pirin family protein [Vagococcus elongatus]RSU15551.1 hypothetical protein CBF29_00300 [Vagococcus elongatus]